MIGTICVVISFPFIFLGCIGCSNAGLISKMFYFIMLVVVFQFGWAATQISHLAMIPELTPSQDERTGLTAIRYSATVMSNIAVYLLAWAFLGKSIKTPIQIPLQEAVATSILINFLKAKRDSRYLSL